MKYIPGIIKKTAVLALFIIIAISISQCHQEYPIDTAQEILNTGSNEEITILFTHDIHSHFDPERFTIQGREGERGGFARMKTVIGNIKSQYPNTFLLDAGDFSMGTLYQTIFSVAASELTMMGLLGFDATTLGNHEFDYRTQGLTEMINAAWASGEKLPLITVANIDWDRTLADNNLSKEAAELKTALERYGISDYSIIEKGGVRYHYMLIPQRNKSESKKIRRSIACCCCTRN